MLAIMTQSPEGRGEDEKCPVLEYGGLLVIIGRISNFLVFIRVIRYHSFHSAFKATSLD